MDVLILAGGKSSRMGGKHKGNLEFGGETFTQRLINEMSKISERIWISYGEEVHKVYEGCEIVHDLFENCGPMGGIHAGLKKAESEIMFVVACDMPFMQAEFVKMLELHMDGDTDIVVPVCNDRMQPSAAIYKKTVLPILEKQLENGNYKLRSMFDKLQISYVEIEDESLKKMFQNINTMDEYKEIL